MIYIYILDIHHGLQSTPSQALEEMEAGDPLPEHSCPKKAKVDAAEAGALETQVDTPAGSPQEKSPPREAQKPAPSTPVQGKGTPSIFAAETIEESPRPGNSDATTKGSPPPAKPDTALTPNAKLSSSPKPYQLSHMARSARKKIPTPKAKALTDEQVADHVPDLDDLEAPKPQLGQHQVSEQAIRMRSQRSFKKRTNGTLKVSQEVFDEWHARGARRKMLEEIFLQVGYDPAAGLYAMFGGLLSKTQTPPLSSIQPKATFISEVEVIRAEMLEEEVVIEGEYASSDTMRSWGFTELAICN